MKCSISWDVRVTIVRCSGLERSRRGKMFYCNIRTPVHRIAIPKVMWLLYPKFWVQTFGIATLWTGVSVFCNLHTAFPLNFPVCVPRPRSVIYCHWSRFRSCYPGETSNLLRLQLYWLQSRIEDDIIVTETGAVRMSTVPRTVEEVEAWMAGDDGFLERNFPGVPSRQPSPW